VYVCMYVCVCNYSSQTTEPICIKIIPANRAFYADCYRLLWFEIFTKYNEFCPRECCTLHRREDRLCHAKPNFTSVGSGIGLSFCHVCPFVHSGVRPDRFCYHDNNRYFMNSLSNLDETYRKYSPASTDDLIKFWRSEVKDTAGHRSDEAIHIDTRALKSDYYFQSCMRVYFVQSGNQRHWES